MAKAEVVLAASPVAGDGFFFTTSYTQQTVCYNLQYTFMLSLEVVGPGDSLQHCCYLALRRDASRRVSWQRQWQWRHTVVTGRRRRSSISWGTASSGNGRATRFSAAMDSKLCSSCSIRIRPFSRFSFRWYSQLLFNFFQNNWSEKSAYRTIIFSLKFGPFIRLFRSIRPVKILLFCKSSLKIVIGP